VTDHQQALERLRGGGGTKKAEDSTDSSAHEPKASGKGLSEEESPLEERTAGPPDRKPFDEGNEEDESDPSAAKKLGVLVTTPNGDVSENLTKAGEINNFKKMSRGEIRINAVKRASDTLSFCFGLGPPAAEALANSRKIKIHIPPLYKLRRMTADDSSSVLPIVADMGSLEMSFVDELGLSEGNICEKKEKECFFDETFCLPRLNIPASSIETARDIDTALKAAEAAVDAVEIFMTLGIFEAAEEGGELLFKQWLKRQRKKGRAAKELRDAGKELSRELEQLRKKIAKDPKSVRRSSVKGYDAEIRAGKHTYRRRTDGTWCRFTTEKCGIKFDAKFESDIDRALPASKAPAEPAAPGLGEQMIKEERKTGIPADAASQSHKHKTDFRAGSGELVESAHMVPTVVVKKVQDYSRSDALTVLLPKGTHRKYDKHWKKWARQRRRELRSQGLPEYVSVAEWEAALNRAAASVPELAGRTADTMSFMIRTEFYQTLGLEPTLLLPLPRR
jgi:hypothetical protein